MMRDDEQETPIIENEIEEDSASSMARILDE
jgi:hypothetical protein